MCQAYCVKCKIKVEMRSPQRVALRNSRPALKDTCPRCGTTVYRLGRAETCSTSGAGTLA